MSKGTSTIKLGGKEWTLRFDMNAIAIIGERFDIKLRPGKIEDDLKALGEHPFPLSAPRTILWAGLLHADEDLAEKTVGSWVDFENVGEVLECFFAQLPGMSPEAEESVRAALGADTNVSSDQAKAATTANS